jgi:hypothetical protein
MTNLRVGLAAAALAILVYGVTAAGLTTTAAAGSGPPPFLPDIIISSTMPPNGDLNPYGVALVFASNGDLLTANGDAVNPDPTQPSEIIEFTKQGKFVAQFNVDAGQGGAFGIAVAEVGPDIVRFVFIDDNANDVTVLDRVAVP